MEYDLINYHCSILFDFTWKKAPTPASTPTITNIKDRSLKLSLISDSSERSKEWNSLPINRAHKGTVNPSSIENTHPNIIHFHSGRPKPNISFHVPMFEIRFFLFKKTLLSIYVSFKCKSVLNFESGDCNYQRVQFATVVGPKFLGVLRANTYVVEMPVSIVRGLVNYVHVHSKIFRFITKQTRSNRNKWKQDFELFDSPISTEIWSEDESSLIFTDPFDNSEPVWIAIGPPI